MPGNQQGDIIDELSTLLDGLTTDAAAYFSRTKEFAPDEDSPDWPRLKRRVYGRDEYWALLPNGLQADAKRLDHRLVSLRAPEDPCAAAGSTSTVMITMPDNGRDPEVTAKRRKAQEKYFGHKRRR